MFLLQFVFYLLPCLFLTGKVEGRLSLRFIMSICYLLTSLVFLAAAVISFAFPGFAKIASSLPVFAAIPAVSFSIFLISGFILLMLAKERSDFEVAKIQESLKKSEIRYKHITELS